MDNEAVTARQIGYTYMINSATFAKRYKYTLSGYETWEQKDYAEQWVFLPQNLGREHGIDETSLQGELYTIVHNKEAHGRKGSIVAVVKGTSPTDVSRVLNQSPEDKRNAVENVTIDLSDSMRAITRTSFAGATAIRYCFHVIKRGGEAHEEMRLKLKREAIRLLGRQKARFRQHLEELAAQRKSYRNRMRAKQKFKEWYAKVAVCTIRVVKSVRDTIKQYEDEILNYFISRQTNASAESLNSKIKCFRAQVKGVKDIPFFMYRMCTVLG
ncbi:MAG: transposase [Bacteroidaceae bacterium]|nr:transposase [Bacteroidaceae bacterium]